MDKCPICLGTMVDITTGGDIYNLVNVYKCEDCHRKVTVPLDPLEVANLLGKIEKAREDW